QPAAGYAPTARGAAPPVRARLRYRSSSHLHFRPGGIHPAGHSRCGSGPRCRMPHRRICIMVTESGQLDLVDMLRENVDAADDRLTSVVDALTVEIDANPEDKLLMEALDVASDAQEDIQALRELLATIRKRDLKEA